ncbi:hypothetical protein FHS29_005515 [Saccharothrix tamanrassetensis]|uniref:Excreted virulence factor EspC (Type VII ESX diderm) n=1 Tax=Saccharothrix tamanrassetensis TaxID=1051531 RepID=A0A841CTZ8_9PSEU|nr:hypothetical protein [Saccharothrix tamanrassetensis]MBB5958906.1 hypothetical protein [Saccharothrix tamanrassetensis]
MTADGFSVDLAELDELARRLLAVADGGRGHVVWRFGIDATRLAESDPLREAVTVYQRSLYAALDRLCGGAERTAAALHAIAAEYRTTDEELAARFARLADTGAGEHDGGSTAIT